MRRIEMSTTEKRMSFLRSRPDLSPALEWRRALIAMTATLGTFGCCLVLRNVSHQPLTVVILGVVLSLSLSRQPARAGCRHQLVRLAAVPLIAVGAESIGRLLLDDINLGATLFIIAMTATMWLRQFGPEVSQVARVLALPITSILVVPGIGLQSGGHTVWWQALVALVALAWVVGTQFLAVRLQFLPADRPGRVAPTTTQARSSRLNGHTRMAVQLAIALTAAFIIGRIFFPQHWNWTVLTATIVCGGGPGRGDVVMKGISRLVGAGVGTVVAAWVATLFPGHAEGAVILIFVLLFVATWWREAHYAVWAASVTCVMALLNTYLGTPNTISLLGTRLEAIVAGAVCATIVCATVLPITTTAMVRRRRGAALQALGELARGVAEDAEDLPQRLITFETRADEVRRTVRPLRVQRALVGRLWSPDPFLLTSVQFVHACRQPARQLVDAVLSEGQGNHGLSQAGFAVVRNIGRTRQLLAGVVEGPVEMTAVEEGPLVSLNAAVLAISQSIPLKPSGELNLSPK
jgi:hypothetical protein